MIRKRNFKLNWKYALGEVTLIFIGITLAFGLQQWAGNQNEYKKSVQYLKAFRIELETNELLLNDQLAETKEKAQNLSNYLTATNAVTADQLKDGDITEMISELGPPYYTSLSTASYQDIINSGGIEFIDNADMRRGLLEYGVSLTEYESVLSRAFRTWETQLAGYYRNHASLADMTLSETTYQISKDVFSNDREAFIRNRTFTNSMRAWLIQSRRVVRSINTKLALIESLKVQINNYVDR